MNLNLLLSMIILAVARRFRISVQLESLAFNKVIRLGILWVDDLVNQWPGR
jgi:hypothetical protein